MDETDMPEKTGLPNDASKANEVKNEQPDYLAELKARDEKIAKLHEEKENYRKMGLKWKKEASEPMETKKTDIDEERLRQIAREELMNSELAKATTEKDDFIKKLARENSEMKTALANKSQISNMPGGASQPNDTITIEKLTKEQTAQLTEQARLIGADPKKFIDRAIENLSKIK